MPSLCLLPGAWDALGPAGMEMGKVDTVVQPTAGHCGGRVRGQREGPWGRTRPGHIPGAAGTAPPDPGEGLCHASEHSAGGLSSGANQLWAPPTVPNRISHPWYPWPWLCHGQALSIRAAWAGVGASWDAGRPSASLQVRSPSAS